MGLSKFIYNIGSGQEVIFAGSRNIHIGKDLNYSDNNNGRKYIPANKINVNSFKEKEAIELNQKLETYCIFVI